MPAEATAQQLGQLLQDVAGIKTDVAVIKERTGALADHESRLRSLESTRARLWAIWGGAVVVGAVLGWLAAYLSGRH
jgi:hypothetical protein